MARPVSGDTIPNASTVVDKATSRARSGHVPGFVATPIAWAQGTLGDMTRSRHAPFLLLRAPTRPGSCPRNLAGLTAMLDGFLIVKALGL
jgi:hypothetical protein